LNVELEKHYFNQIDIVKFLEEVGVVDANIILKSIEHFTEEEVAKRDQVILNYFGEKGLKRIVEAIVSRMLAPPLLKADSKILDVGAGSGYFTINVANLIQRHSPQTSFYAMDITPAMLSTIVRKTTKITPFLGVAENVKDSIKFARKYVEVPDKFDVIFSTLTLHHCPDVERVFRSLKGVLEKDGKVIIVDLCEHPFKEFMDEMGDVHLGFNPHSIEEMAKRLFKEVYVERMPGISCTCSGRSADLFIAYLIV
jgi:SAM-dependent methyltransferase